MRLGGDPVGRWGLTLLAVAGVVGVILAIHGWAGRASGVVPAALPAGSGSTAGRAAAGPSSGPSASPSSHPATSASAAPSASSSTGPLLSAEPYASYAFQVWPGTLSTAAKQALTGLTVSVHRQSGGLSVTRRGGGGAARVPDGRARICRGGLTRR